MLVEIIKADDEGQPPIPSRQAAQCETTINFCFLLVLLLGREEESGTAAMDGWKKMLAILTGKEREDQRKALLEYCKLDTLAMVRIYQFVDELVSN